LKERLKKIKDLMMKEKKMQWRLEKIAEEERKNNRKA